MSCKIITTRNFDDDKITNEVVETKVALFKRRGRLMYVNKLEQMVEILTKKELITLLRMFDGNDWRTNANVLKVKFSSLTEDMSKVSRSRFKKKLIENGILFEYNRKIMVNPFILVPGIDKNIANFQYMVQSAWVYLVEDKDKIVDGLDEFIDYIFSS